MINALVNLAGINLLILSCYNRESLTKCVILQTSPDVVGYIKRLILAKRKEVGGRNTINCTLDNGIEIFFEVGMGYPY